MDAKMGNTEEDHELQKMPCQHDIEDIGPRRWAPVVRPYLALSNELLIDFT